MSENGHSQEKPKVSVFGELIGMVEDHLDLAAVEWEYEKKLNARRLGAWAVAVLLGLSAFVFMQAGVVMGIASFGIPTGWACAIVAGFDCVLAGIVVAGYAQRDAKAGEPFRGTRQELRKNAKWIQQLFS